MTQFKPRRSATRNSMLGRSQDDGRDYRLGGAAMGLFIGLLMGLVSAGAVLVLFKGSPSFAHFVFGGGAAGVIVGALFPGAVLNASEGTVHFLLGFFSGAGENFEIEQSRHAPTWLRIVFGIGLVLGLVLCAFYWLWV
ncbi:hypothetical protein [Variovorax rhizosphaerae]|uniref:Uncharacterized protein n=1 Tax=Variovorax rhizosphaerae TaxID=1836200 RepID=A0ABU8WP13_9BURK